MDRNLFRYIWRHSLREQGEVLALVALSLPFYFFSLNLPKLIVSGPIEGRGFEDGAETILPVQLPGWLGGFTLFEGMTLDRVSALLALAFTFLALVCVNGLFKFQINTMKGRMGERVLRRLRYELIDRTLRMPPQKLKRMKPAEVASMVKDEVEPLGGFVGEAFATPAFLGGQAATALLFILLQSFWLGLIAVVVVAVQALLIPWLRKPILELGRQRQLTARQLSGRVGEIVDAGADIQANDASNWERAEVTRRLGRIYDIRFAIYRRKFFVKFLNNFLAQVTPFFFYAIGGYLAITGDLSIGQLVAVIAAYKDLPAPVKELLDWYLEQQDAQIKYDQVVSQFRADILIDPDAQAPGAPARLKGEVVARDLTVVDESGARLLDGANFAFAISDHVAFAGPPGGGKEAAAMTLARQLSPRGGELEIAGGAITGLPQSVTGRRIAYVGQDAYVFPMTIRDNLLYGVRNEPRGAAPRGPDEIEAWRRRHAEDRRAANAPYDAEADWTDYETLGVAPGDPDAVDAKLLAALDVAGLAPELFGLGLQGRFEEEDAPAVAARIVEARRLFRERENAEPQDVVEHFAEDDYNHQATVAENLLFAVPVDPSYQTEALGSNVHVLTVLDETGLREPLFEMGREIAETMVEIFRGLPADHPFFGQFSFIASAELPQFESWLARLAQGQRLPQPATARILSLAFAYVEPRHRLGLLDDPLRAKILLAHAALLAHLPLEEKAKLAFYDPDHYLDAASVEDNILFGRVVYGSAGAGRRAREILDGVIKDLDLARAVARVGLGYPCGAAGKRLTPSQRQRLALARALLKDPCLLVVNGALAVLDPTAQLETLKRVRAARTGKGVVWTAGTEAEAQALPLRIDFAHGKAIQAMAETKALETAATGGG